ncbi:MAG: hypothetical protein JRI72_17805 [Deltaproteobacteria bacterium]|jgi:hypothetical protein|nr:hypothetical protein [Deltaproteobacteria bacterium]
MQELKQNFPEFVVCINNSDYPASLELHKIYRVLVDKDATEKSDIRIIDESGEDYLYPSSYFVPIQVPQTVEKSLLRAS